MRAARNIAIFLAMLALGAWALRATLPEPYVPIVTTKLAHFIEHGEEFDTLFIGSSRTYRQIVPEIFDGILGAAGEKVRSYNLGVDGMRPPEDTYLLEHALAKRRAPLKWVFVECNYLRTEIRDQDRGTVRAIYWHDWPRYAATVHGMFFADTKKRRLSVRWREASEAWPDFTEHTGYFLERQTSLGRGHEAMERWLFARVPKQPDLHELGPRRDGHKFSDAPEQMPPAVLALYKEDLARALETPAKPDPGDPATLADLAEKRRLVERHGGRLVLYIAPFTAKIMLHPAGDVLDFSDPRKYSALFDPANRSDRGHVNTAGSRIFTDILAREFLATRPK